MDIGSFELQEVTLPCDFTGAVGCDIDDIDALYAGTNGAPTPLTSAAINQWLADASSQANPLKPTTSTEYVIGDVNLDGNVDSADLGLLLNNFSDNNSLGWGFGNLNVDSIVDSVDLGLLLNSFGFESPLAVAATQASAIEIDADGDNVDSQDPFSFTLASDQDDEQDVASVELVDQIFTDLG